MNATCVDLVCSRILRRTLVVALLSLGVAIAPAAAVSIPGASALTERALGYLHGEGVARDVDRGVVFLCAAARMGHGPAAFELGWLYLHGRGVARDDALAQGWFDEARRLGESLPPHLAKGPANDAPADTACITSAGAELPVTNRHRAELVVTIHELAPRYDLDPSLVVEVVRAESNFDPRARSHKGALGLMQLIPATARRFGVRDPLEPIQNLHGGMAYLRWLLDRFDGDLALSLAGYNAGEAAVDRHGGIPPYAETRAYVRRILARYEHLI